MSSRQSLVSAKGRGCGPRRAERSTHPWYIIAVLLTAMLLSAAGCGAAQEPAEAGPKQIAAEIMPQEGDTTPYGIPLSLHNTQRFINYYNTISLTPEQEKVKREALTALRAPCCDDNSMYNC